MERLTKQHLMTFGHEELAQCVVDVQCDYDNYAGRITQLLDIPWDSSAGKVCQEIRKLQSIKQDCNKHAKTAGMECGNSIDRLFERLSLIQQVTER